MCVESSCVCMCVCIPLGVCMCGRCGGYAVYAGEHVALLGQTIGRQPAASVEARAWEWRALLVESSSTQGPRVTCAEWLCSSSPRSAVRPACPALNCPCPVSRGHCLPCCDLRPPPWFLAERAECETKAMGIQRRKKASVALLHPGLRSCSDAQATVLEMPAQATPRSRPPRCEQRSIRPGTPALHGHRAGQCSPWLGVVHSELGKADTLSSVLVSGQDLVAFSLVAATEPFLLGILPNETACGFWHEP